MIRYAAIQDQGPINALRRDVNDLHTQGRPDIFKPGFSREFQDHVLPYLRRENGYAAVAEREQRIAGMVMVDYILRPENPYTLERRFVHIAEICVHPDFRRQGVGEQLLDFVKSDARAQGFRRIELDVWAFNDALSFYEKEGFTTFRRFMELFLD